MRRFFKRLGLYKIASIAIVLSGAATIAEVCTLPYYLIIALATLAAIMLGIWAFLVFDRRHLPDLPEEDNGFSIRPIKTPAEFQQVDAIYQHCFVDASVPTVILKSWWTTFPEGIIGLFYNDRVIGGLSIWPLKEATFNSILNGHIQEKEIRDSGIEKEHNGKWYISEIAIERRHCDIATLCEFLTYVIDFFEKKSAEKFPAVVLSLAYSTQGHNLLKRAGFIMELNADQTPDRQPLFSLTLNDKQELNKIRQRLVIIPERIKQRNELHKKLMPRAVTPGN